MKRIALVFSVCTLIFSFIVKSQFGGNSTLDELEQKKVIDSVGFLLINNYIFPDVAKKMNDLLQENYRKGNYKSTTNVGAFATQLTTDLQSISKDKHLHVNFNPGGAAQMKKAQSSGQPNGPNMDAMRMN